MNKSELQSLLIELAAMRQRAESLRAVSEKCQAAMLATNEGLQYYTTHLDAAQAADDVKELENIIRPMVVELYAANPEGGKKPAPGVGIRAGKRAIYDPDTARKYCLEKLPGLMDLNVAKFEKMATGGLYPFDFVTIEEVFTATIASDLSEYLPAEASPAAQPEPTGAAVEDATD